MNILRYFDYDHLPAGPLRDTSAEFARMADRLDATLPAGPELTVSLRKLLEAKDAAVRAALSVDARRYRRLRQSSVLTRSMDTAPSTRARRPARPGGG